MITRSGAPFSAAVVAWPDRKECPASRLGRIPAALAARLTIKATVYGASAWLVTVSYRVTLRKTGPVEMAAAVSEVSRAATGHREEPAKAGMPTSRPWLS